MVRQGSRKVPHAGSNPVPVSSIYLIIKTLVDMRCQERFVFYSRKSGIRPDKTKKPESSLATGIPASTIKNCDDKDTEIW